LYIHPVKRNLNPNQVNARAKVMLMRVPRMYQSAQARSSVPRLEYLKIAFPATITERKLSTDTNDIVLSKYAIMNARYIKPRSVYPMRYPPYRRPPHISEIFSLAPFPSQEKIKSIIKPGRKRVRRKLNRIMKMGAGTISKGYSRSRARKRMLITVINTPRILCESFIEPHP
jgi:hypothetical protein